MKRLTINWQQQIRRVNKRAICLRKIKLRSPAFQDLFIVIKMEIFSSFISIQTVSVTVSILTLTFISIDRWYAICFPLRYKPQPGRAIIWIAIIWTVALLFDLPEFFVLHTTSKELRFDIKLFTQCVASWTFEDEKLFNIVKAIVLYTWVDFSFFTNPFRISDFALLKLFFYVPF